MCSGSTGRVGPVAKPGCPDGPRRTALAMTSREEDGATLRLLETTGKSQERPRRRVRRSLRRRQPKRCGVGRAECSVQNVAAHRELITARLPECSINSYTKRCVHTPGPGRDKAGSQPRVSRTRRGLRAVDYNVLPARVRLRVQKSEPKVESPKVESPKVESQKSRVNESRRVQKSSSPKVLSLPLPGQISLKRQKCRNPRFG